MTEGRGAPADTQAPLLITDEGGVRRITFNRPAVHNAQNRPMLEHLLEALQETKQRRDIRVLILAGAGRSFTSGHDLKAVVDDPDYAANTRSAEARYWQEMRLFVEPVQVFRDLPIPTISRVQGYCFAAGLMFVCASDFVVAADDTVFGSPVLTTQGVNDAEVPGFAWSLGDRRAKQAIWLNERIDAAEARRLGLVNWVVSGAELDARIETVVAQLLTAPREALALSKATFRFMQDRLGQSDVDRFHFVVHQFSHQTAEAQALLQDRIRGSAGAGGPGGTQ